MRFSWKTTGAALALSAAFAFGQAQAADFSVTVTGTNPKAGHIIVGVFDVATGGADSIPEHAEVIAPAAKGLGVTFSDIPPGVYAVAVYQEPELREIREQEIFMVRDKEVGITVEEGFLGAETFEAETFIIDKKGLDIGLDLRD